MSSDTALRKIILVVDEDRASLRDIGLNLRIPREFRYEVIPVSNGRDALELVKHNLKSGRVFAGAFVALQMPGMNGLEFAKVAASRGYDFPLIFVQDGDRGDFNHAVLRSYSKAVITKPLNVAMLAKAVVSTFEAVDLFAKERKIA